MHRRALYTGKYGIENERKNMVRKHRKKHVYDSKELIAKNRFVEEIQKRYSTLDPTQKIIVQAQTKLPTFRWYREEKISPKMQKKKPINGCHKEELLQKCRKI